MYSWQILVKVYMIALIFCHIFMSKDVAGLPDEPSLTYDILYNMGIEAYSDERWYECISYMLKALEDYKYLKDNLVHCRSKCHQETDNLQYEVKNLDLNFFEKAIKHSLCVLKCKRHKFGSRPESPANSEVEEEFENRVPYDYLQLCFYKIDEIERAVQAAYTFLLANPDHEVTRDNIRFYQNLPNVKESFFRNLEAQRYQDLFLEGGIAYNDEEYVRVIGRFEQALEEYFEADDSCRMLCEGPFNHDSFPDFYIAIANHFTGTLRCKKLCEDKLSVFNGENHDNFLPSFYHYLQYAYYKTSNLEQACAAVASFLLFSPEDEIMLHNQKFYATLDGVSEDMFKPRAEALLYFKRNIYETELLDYIENNFLFDDSLEVVVQLESPPIPPITKKTTSTETLSDQQKSNPALQYTLPATISRVIRTSYEEITDVMREKKHVVNVNVLKKYHSGGVQITLRDKDLNGTLRFAADGFASQGECEDLIKLASVSVEDQNNSLHDGAQHGDGYRGNQFPHTKFEKFEGLTVGRAAYLAKQGILSHSGAKLFIDLSERGREYVESYFDLDSTLYFSYTHLVCRTAQPDSSDDRTDFSHPVHADNCILKSDGICVRELPAYTWRDYSAIMYLNEDFEGGEFIFANPNNTIQASVKPRCGRLVGFSAGGENLHGVRAVIKGRRCALAMWYTLNPKYNEREFVAAQQLLAEMELSAESHDHNEF